MKRGRGGIEYEDVTPGKGPSAERGCTVEIRYDLRLNRGDLVQENEVCVFRLGDREVIPGLEYGVEGMLVGGERRIRVGSHLGYREHGVPGVVPPHALLEFHVTLVRLHATTKSCHGE